MIGKRIEMLVVVERLPGSKFVCRCDCGKTRTVHTGHFNSGAVKSCGCHHWHGYAKDGAQSREYVAYGNMIARCHNKKNKRYSGYGGVGILVCDYWRQSFSNFISDMGNCPDGYQIDRIDNSKGYFKENCQWVTPKKNMANRSISQIWTVHGIEFSSASDAGKKFNVSANTIVAWCKGRTVKGIYYKPKEGCNARNLIAQ